MRGVPTSRLIIGKREIDIYPDGSMYEKGNLSVATQALIFLRDPTARQPGARSGDVITQRVLVFVTAMLVPLVAIAQTAPPAQPFQRLDGCVYKSQRWNRIVGTHANISSICTLGK